MDSVTVPNLNKIKIHAAPLNISFQWMSNPKSKTVKIKLPSPSSHTCSHLKIKAFSQRKQHGDNIPEK